jgi:HAD superfamily hydrolase (TIGR01490 family)
LNVAAFFDLDRTLIGINSGVAWARHERRTGNISRWQMARAVVWGALYHLSLANVERAFEEALRHYKTQPEADLDQRTRDWFEQHVREHLRPGAARALDEHRAQGHPLVLLSSCSSFEARAAAEAFALDGWLANEFPVDAEGRLVGSFVSPLCYGAGKVARAEVWAAEHEVDLDRSYFYSDSYSDLPMLERVGEPRVIAPDPRLKRAARRRGWPIVDWDGAAPE